jgi:hypothetical protein
MHPHNTRGGRAARLGLESLEGRIVLSAAAPVAPLPVAGQSATASEMQIQHLPSQGQATYATFGYHWGAGSTGTVIQGTNPTTGNGKSTGSVAFALVRDGHETARVGGPTVWTPLGFVMTSSSASAAHPDHFHASVTITLQLRDAASGKTGTLTFKGTIDGTMTWNASHLTVTFAAPVQKLTLGHHVYTVTLPHTFHPVGPTAMPLRLYAQLQVAKV